MIDLLPEPKVVHEDGNKTKKFKNLWLKSEQGISEELIALSRERFWNYQEVKINETEENILEVMLVDSLDNIDSDQKKLFQEQGYDINISKENVILRYENRVGFLNGMTTLKQLLEKSKDSFVLPICHITDWPSLEVRAIAQTFSWYAGYGRFGFDSQLWGFEEWKQYLNICLDNKIKILIFDELTAVLQEKDIENIFRIISVLKEKGIGIIYISHRLEEVFECCDSYTVLCDGKYINSGKVKDIDYDGLVKMIIGRELENVYPPINEEFGDVILEVRNLTAPKAFRNINLQVRKGEVIGLAGLLGAGKTELVQAIFGNHKVTDGEILIKGKPVKIKSPQQAIKLGMGLVPDERRTLGLVMKFDIKDNTVLPSMKLFRKAGVFQDHKAEMKAAYEINEKMNLAYHSLWQNVKKLSGGNQQKIVIAKWMLRDTEIFLLDEPTRGIDIGAKFEIYNLIHELTKQKKAVILVSPEMEELIGLCNRVYVMYEGEILDEVEGERKTQEVIINNLLGVNAE